MNRTFYLTDQEIGWTHKVGASIDLLQEYLIPIGISVVPVEYGNCCAYTVSENTRNLAGLLGDSVIDYGDSAVGQQTCIRLASGLGVIVTDVEEGSRQRSTVRHAGDAATFSDKPIRWAEVGWPNEDQLSIVLRHTDGTNTVLFYESMECRKIRVEYVFDKAGICGCLSADRVNPVASARKTTDVDGYSVGQDKLTVDVFGISVQLETFNGGKIYHSNWVVRDKPYHDSHEFISFEQLRLVVIASVLSTIIHNDAMPVVRYKTDGG